MESLGHPYAVKWLVTAVTRATVRDPCSGVFDMQGFAISAPRELVSTSKQTTTDNRRPVHRATTALRHFTIAMSSADVSIDPQSIQLAREAWQATSIEASARPKLSDE